MKPPLKVGDRVWFMDEGFVSYDVARRKVLKSDPPKKIRGEIIVLADHHALIRTRSGAVSAASLCDIKRPKQRRRWTLKGWYGASGPMWEGPALSPGEVVEVVEVKGKGK